MPREKRSTAQRRALVELMMADDPAFRAELPTLTKLRAAEPKFVTTMVVARALGSASRPTFVHLGGDFTRKGERVEPGRSRRLARPGRSRARATGPIAWTWPAGWSIAATR